MIGMAEDCEIEVRPICYETDLEAAASIWNEVVRDGVAFPQDEELALETAREFFDSQTAVGVAVEVGSGKVCGLYILHPNNVGRLASISNASYAVASNMQGRHIGAKLVLDSIETAKREGFHALQFNAVVESNASARRLYSKLGFEELGRVPSAFRRDDGTYENVYIYVYDLTK